MQSPFINFSATNYTANDVKMAAKKRYSQPIDEQDIEGATADGIEKGQTLAEVIDELVDLYVRTDGHERFRIFTPEQIAERKSKANKLGVIGALINVVDRPFGANEVEIKNAVRTQLVLRKITLNDLREHRLISDLVSACCEAKFFNYQPAAYLNGRLQKVATWTTNKKPRAKEALVRSASEETLLKLFPEGETV